MGLIMSDIRYLVQKCADIDILCLNIDMQILRKALSVIETYVNI